MDSLNANLASAGVANGPPNLERIEQLRVSALKGKVSVYVNSLNRPPSEEAVLANLQDFLLDTSYWNRHSTPLHRVTLARFIAMLDEELANVSSYVPFLCPYR